MWRASVRGSVTVLQHFVRRFAYLENESLIGEEYALENANIPISTDNTYYFNLVIYIAEEDDIMAYINGSDITAELGTQITKVGLGWLARFWHRSRIFLIQFRAALGLSRAMN